MMAPGHSLRSYRKQRKVTQEELASELGLPHKSAVCRMERRELTPLQYTEAVAAVERIVARRLSEAVPPEVAVQS
jgi:transcriptional regulator with XRE-family HTH domain